MKMKTESEADVNITSLIDCLMQCIIFFMVILSAQYIYGVAIKFPPPGGNKEKTEQKEKRIIVYVQADQIVGGPDGKQHVLQDGNMKLNGKEFAVVPGIAVICKGRWTASFE
jgi:biopolymer transport protein ExbD